ncbi:MAG TPA: YIP1 family protein [Thermoanaerobaculia bacterium]|nr:YIP1 family protein [Thermoanaerobaculia bacterium]
MSTVPPQPPSTLPPVTVTPLPWEARDTRGFLPALFDTLGLFWSRPSEAWARTRESGDVGSPLLFAVLVAWVSIIIQTVTLRVINMPALPGRWGRFGMMQSRGIAGLIGTIVLAPIIVMIILFIMSLILHVACLIVGALNNSTAGLEGTLRVVAYSDAAHIASVVPFIGPLIALVWWIYLAVMGISRIHHTTQGKAIAAILIPFVVCCGGVALLAMLAGAAYFSRFGR